MLRLPFDALDAFVQEHRRCYARRMHGNIQARRSLVSVAIAGYLLLSIGASITAAQDTDECKRRAALAERLDKLESRSSRPPYAALLPEVRALEKEMESFASILSGSCGDNLDRAVLERRFGQVRNIVQERAAAERRRKDTQAEELRYRQAEERRRHEIVAKPWSDQIKQAVLDRKVLIGMTTEHVVTAWGRPQTINETISATARDEQWVYPGPVYLYFSNGVLHTMQRSR